MNSVSSISSLDADFLRRKSASEGGFGARRLRYTGIDGIKGWVGVKFLFFFYADRYAVVENEYLTLYEDESMKKVVWAGSLHGAQVARGMAGTDIVVCTVDDARHSIRPPVGAFSDWWTVVNQAAALKIEKFYKLCGLLGQGSFSRVRLAKDLQTGQEVAVKIMPRSSLKSDLNVLQRREIAVMRAIDHENIVKLIDVFEGPKRIYFVLEYVRGGMLYDYILRRSEIYEHEVRRIFKQILLAVRVCHEHGIVHRDLKLDNIMCTSQEKDTDIKVTDFGLAGLIDGVRMMHSFVGTPLYMAPELLELKPYDESVDMWSSGVILYGLLTGTFPHRGERTREILESIQTKDYGLLPPSASETLSDDCQSLVYSLLQYNPKKRLSASAALHHPWFLSTNDDFAQGRVSSLKYVLGTDDHDLLVMFPNGKLAKNFHVPPAAPRDSLTAQEKFRASVRSMIAINRMQAMVSVERRKKLRTLFFSAMASQRLLSLATGLSAQRLLQSSQDQQPESSLPS
ncbi:putative myosin light chain kinase [Porphyridium purpureum]|uniref:Putative myosin light chain kinase n=1 Tax=Porphyridium purpureum TaxID=35688 RepID=A0A5J4Z7D8_PORPP|nr:putative myosin light chain kinase [Porphyridium purpureum]|eukprot:POR8334..scf295_1